MRSVQRLVLIAAGCALANGSAPADEVATAPSGFLGKSVERSQGERGEERTAAQDRQLALGDLRLARASGDEGA